MRPESPIRMIPGPGMIYTMRRVKLTKDDGSQYGIAMNPSNEQDGWMNVIYSMGGNVISDDMKKSGFDDPNTIKAMEYVDKLVKTQCLRQHGYV